MEKTRKKSPLFDEVKLLWVGKVQLCSYEVLVLIPFYVQKEYKSKLLRQQVPVMKTQ